MMNSAEIFKTDATRRMDQVIDCFGEGQSYGEPPSAVRRTTWLTRGRSKPLLPMVFLEHPLALDPLRAQGA